MDRFLIAFGDWVERMWRRHPVICLLVIAALFLAASVKGE
jgi:hypothetical protein